MKILFGSSLSTELSLNIHYSAISICDSSYFRNALKVLKREQNIVQLIYKNAFAIFKDIACILSAFLLASFPIIF